MRTIQLFNILAVSTCLLAACNDHYTHEQKDWDNTTAYFNSSDENGTTTYYRPSVGTVGDPMPFYDPVAKEYKVLYLHNFEQNLEQTFHPIWGVRTTDAATYTPIGEVLPTGRDGEQDAALGTGCVVYDEQQQLYYIYYTGERYKPAADEDRQVVMRATSPDFKTWTRDQLFRRKETGSTEIMPDTEGVTHYQNDNILRLQEFESDWNCQMLACWGHVLDFCSAGIVDMNPDGNFKGRILGIGFAAYQWGNSNDYIGNVKKLTKNAINYLTGEIEQAVEHNTVAPKAVKTIQNGQLVILKDGVRFNALGTQL